MPFIVLEGLDGAGKSTQLQQLVSCLDERGARHEYLHFPRFDAPVYGELIARFLRGEFGEADEVSPWLVALLFASDRAGAAPMMRGWLEEGRFVLTDRFVYSNVAYQCAKVDDVSERKRLADWILELEYGHNDLPRPDVSLFLDVPFRFTTERLTLAREGGDRDYLDGRRDIHESSLELQARVREVYLERALADPSLRVVDCSDGQGDMASPEAVFAKIFEQIEGLL